MVGGRKLGAAALLVFLALFFQTPSAQGQAAKRDEENLRRLEQAVAAISAGELTRAESLLRAALAASPRDADALNLLGVVRAQQQRAAEAERLFQRAVASAPTHLGARVNLGELYLTTNRPQLALPTLLAAHKLAPERADINLNLAMIYKAQGEHERALERLRLIPREAASADYFPLLLETLLALKRLDEARLLAREFKEASDGAAEAQAKFALLLAGGGLLDEALDLLDNARRQSPASFPTLFALGVVNRAAKRYEVAEGHLNEALRMRPDDVTTLRALAHLARATGNREKALAHLLRARRLAPVSPGVLYDFGVVTLEMDLALDALPVFEQLRRSYPREPTYLYALAAARYKKGELAECARLMKGYVGLRPRDAGGFYLLGGALRGLKQFAEARAALERSLQLKPDPDTEYLLGLTLYEEGSRAAAIETFQRVVSARPNHAAALAALGVAYREQGKHAEARETLERAVRLDAKDLRSHYQLGLVYAKLGDKEAATKMFARADDLRGEERRRESVVLKLIDLPQN